MVRRKEAEYVLFSIQNKNDFLAFDVVTTSDNNQKFQ